jgi:hypothetical protein
MIKYFIYLNFLINAVLSVPIKKVPIDILLEGLAQHYDDEGCCITCGYNWCPSLEECVRFGEVYCKEFDFPYNVLYKGSGIIIPS